MADYENKLFECQTVNEIQVIVEEEYNDVCHSCDVLLAIAQMVKCDVRAANLYAKFANLYLELLKRKELLEFILSASFVDDGEVIRVIDLYFAFICEQKEKVKNTSCH